MLDIQNLHAYYGKSHVLHGVHFNVGPGEIVALLGRNGSGRSTTAKAIMGLVDCEGDIAWKGQLRMCQRYRHLMAAGKPKVVVTTAIAREMAGFIWAIARCVTPVPEGAAQARG